MSEIYSLIGEEVKRSGHAGMLPAGVVLTGGGARIAGAAELARDVLQMPVRVGAPQGVGGLMDQLVEPGLQHAHRPAAVGRPPRWRGADGYATSSSLSGVGGAAWSDWIRGIFPADPGPAPAESAALPSTPPRALWITSRPVCGKNRRRRAGVAR